MTAMSPYSFTAREERRLAPRGLSLVELTVGLAIGLVLTLGLFTLISNQSLAFKVQNDFARMQENGATALRYIGDSVRMAGFYGYTMNPANIDTTIGGVTMSAGPTDDCGSTTNSTSDRPRGAGLSVLRAANECELVAVMGMESVTVRRAQRCDANRRSHQSVRCRTYSAALPRPRYRHVPATRH